MGRKKQTKKKKSILPFLAVVLLVVIGIFALSGHETGIKAIDESGFYIYICNLKQDIIETVREIKESLLNISTADVIRENLELPASIPGHQIVRHTGYTLSYNEQYEQADWVAYELTSEKLNATVSRKDNFREDPSILTGSAHLQDYRGSGYDRGHLANSQDFCWSEQANDDTFFMSNMTPQIHGFNAGLWLNCEKAVREAAKEFGSVYVATGPVFSKEMKTIGSCCSVAVPESFYKVLLAFDQNNNVFAIGMICPQSYEDSRVHSYLCSVNDVEDVTGLDFFPNLDDSIEESVESTFNPYAWPGSFQNR